MSYANVRAQIAVPLPATELVGATAMVAQRWLEKCGL